MKGREQSACLKEGRKQRRGWRGISYGTHRRDKLPLPRQRQTSRDKPFNASFFFFFFLDSRLLPITDLLSADP